MQLRSHFSENCSIFFPVGLSVFAGLVLSVITFSFISYTADHDIQTLALWWQTALPLCILLISVFFATYLYFILKQREEREKSVHALQFQISERKIAETSLRESEALFRAIFDQSTDSILLIETKNGRIATFNSIAHISLGYTSKAFSKLNIEDIEAEDSPEKFKAHLLVILAKGSDYFEARHRTQSGALRDVMVTVSPIRVKENAFILAVIQDITERKRAIEAERLASTVFQTASEGIMVTDIKRNIISVNPAFTEISGYAETEVLGKTPGILQSGRHDKHFYRRIWARIKKKGHWQGEVWNKRKNGKIHPIWLSITAVKDGNNQIIQYTGLFSDITKRKAYEEKLHHYAYHDPLTKLPNRMLLIERLSMAIKQAKRSGGKVALLYIDLDRFKQINDTLGHALGDMLLLQTAERIRNCLREADTLARSGGDEFLVLLPTVEDRAAISIVCEKILDALSYPFQLDAHHPFIGASIGISIAPDDGEDAGVLLKNADMAMYRVKNSGRNHYHFFNEKMGKVAEARTLLGWDLRQALEKEALILHYQPIIDLHSLKTIAVETLVRWLHPAHGLLLPGRFIPLAEESGLISRIGTWVIENACRQAVLWQKQYGQNLSISVNLSTRQFFYGDLSKIVSNALEKSGLEPKFLTLEITESLMSESIDNAKMQLYALKDLGVQLAIDDFGKGYSSLSRLSLYPVDQLKIDSSFILHVASDANRRRLVEAIVRMGQSMKYQVIAEGVEEYEDLSYLMSLGCNAVQGHYLSRPLTASDYEAVLEKSSVA